MDQPRAHRSSASGLRQTARLSAPGVAVGAALFVALLLAQGAMGVTKDGMAYLDVAADITDGRWFTDPTYIESSHFPPGLSLALAAISLATGLTTTASAGLLNLVAMVGLIGGTASYLRRQGTTLTPPLIALAALLLGASTALLRLNVNVLSDVPFLACAVAAALALDLERRRPGRASFAMLVAACLCAGLLRYPGVMLALGAAAAIILWDRSGRGVGRAVALLGLSWVPLLGWVVAVSVSGPAELRDHSPSSDLTLGEVAHSVSALGIAALGGGYEVVGTLYGPLDVPFRLAGAALGVVILGLIGAWSVLGVRDLLRHGRAAGSSSALAIVVVLYVGFVALTRFVQGYSVLDRYWLPVLVLGLLGLLGFNWVTTPRNRRLLSALLIGLAGANFLRSALLVVDRLVD